MAPSANILKKFISVSLSTCHSDATRREKAEERAREESTSKMFGSPHSVRPCLKSSDSKFVFHLCHYKKNDRFSR